MPTNPFAPPFIPAADLAAKTPGSGDYVVGVDAATGNPRRFPVTDMPASAVVAAQIATLQAGQTAGMLGFQTKAMMDAALAYNAGTLALVTNDPTPANNGAYRKVGASGSGSWVLSADRVTGLEGRVADYDNKFKNQTGIKNGWPDPFFRTFDLTSETFFGRDRWYWGGAGGGGSFMNWSRVVNTVFDGYALRRTAGAGTVSLSGPSVWLDEIGATAGDQVTAYLLIVGAGAVVDLRAKFDNGSQLSGTLTVGSGGAGSITASATPQWLRITAPVPAGAKSLDLYPYTVTAAKGFDVVAVWAFKGAASAGPSWPTLQDGVAAENARRVGGLEASQALISGKSDYAVDNYTIVTGAQSIAISGTGFSTAPRDLVFMGWGETFTPAGVSFNAIKIKSIARTTGATAKWRTLNVVVRTGTGSAGASSTLIAVGSATVIESKDSQADVVIILRDPATNAVKTLTDADFSGGEYFIGVYGLTSAGTPAATGEPRGTLANSMGQSYYHSSGINAPKTAAWSATVGGSNLRMGFQHLLITSPAETIGYLPTQALANDLGSLTPLAAPELVMPAYVFGVQGREMNVYVDNLHLASSADYFHNIDTSGSYGAQQNERFTWTPSGAVATGTLTVTAHDKRSGAALVSKTTQLRSAAASAGTGMTKKVLVIGDSLIDAGTITQTMLDIVTGGDPMGLTLLGTRGTGSNKHEGRGGWTIATYTTNYSDVPNGANPFWVSGAVNFGAYLTNNSIATPDWVFIHLGINDCFSQTDDAACSTAADSAFTSLDILINSIKAADANVKIGLMIPTPPSSDQDAFGASYGTGQARFRFKRNILIWARQLCAKYNGQEASRIYAVPTNVAYDTVNNSSRAASAPVNSRSAVTATRQNNGVHPATEGYRQIGDALWAFLKYHA